MRIGLGVQEGFCAGVRRQLIFRMGNPRGEGEGRERERERGQCRLLTLHRGPVKSGIPTSSSELTPMEEGLIKQLPGDEQDPPGVFATSEWKLLCSCSRYGSRSSSEEQPR